jgi:hypothetical protein
MKAKIVSGSALAAAAIALALSGAATAPAFAKAGHQCTMAKGSCGGKMKCMTKKGVCKHKVMPHKGSCHHSKSHCKGM